MSRKISGYKKISISHKTALINSIVVLALLSLVAGFIIKKQSILVDYILMQYEGMVQQTLENQNSRDIRLLKDRHGVNAKICSVLAGYFVYTFDSDGLKKNLKSLMALPDISAIQVFDADGQPFLALWNDTGVVKDGATIGNATHLNRNKVFVEDIYYENEKIGNITLFYTDAMLQEQMAQIKNSINRDVYSLREKIDANIQTAKYTQLSAFVFVVVILIITIMTSLRFIVTRRLQKVTSNLCDIAEGEGDLTKRLNDRYNDEIGELCKWFNIFVEKIHNTIRDVASGSKNLDDASDNLAQISNTMKDDAKHTSFKVSNVTDSSTQMNENMNSVASAMEEASANINMVASAAEEMSATICQISENAEQAQKITMNAVEQSTSASVQVKHLGSAAEDIGKVLETITEISEQVNLLALNATIEAARAGESGRGFAVVANEIKDLAKQTAAATDEIRAKIEGIQSTTEGTITHIEQISEVVNEVNSIVSTITIAIEEQSQATNEIATNVAQASEGLGEVNENVAQANVSVGTIAEEIREVDVATSKISETSTHIKNNADQLSNLSDQLNKLVKKFQV